MSRGVRLEEWLRWFAHPFVVLSAGCMHSTVFAPGSSEMAVLVGGGRVVFLYLFVQNLPQGHRHTVIFSPILFLYIL